jgi:Transposase DDE domain
MATPSPSKKGRAAKRPGASTVRHTRAIQRDRTKRPLVAPLSGPVEQGLTELIHPATLAQVEHFHQLGLRERVLTLPVMVALVVTMLWRQIPAGCELVRLLSTEGFLWISPLPVSEQALSQRLRVFPAVLFQRVLEAVLPLLLARAQARQRPLPAPLAWARERYPAVLAADGSTLDALIRKVGLLRDLPKAPLAGRILAVLDVTSLLPRQVTYTPDAQAHDHRFWPAIQAAVPAGALLLLDAGFIDFACYRQLTQAHIRFITRAKSNLTGQPVRTFAQTATLHDTLLWIGKGAERQQIRLIEGWARQQWYRYLTNELDPVRLPAEMVIALYAQRWRIEDAFAAVKRLLGLAYFWVGSENGVQLQVWATWLLYAVLVDMTDAIAEVLQRPFADLSLEMTYRGLYYATQAYHRGEAPDPIAYLAANARLLGIIKRKRKQKSPKGELNGPT